MVLELHIWGPAFGLPSIDAECLAAVAYLNLALPRDQWRLLVAADPAVSPAHTLPALRHNGTWTTGFGPIVSHLQQHSAEAAAKAADRTTTPGGAATAHNPSRNLTSDDPDLASRDPDAALGAAQRADATALAAHLASRARELLDLSLYASAANWAATTRPALTAVVPFPLSWTVPPALRAAAVRRVEALGLDLDVDDDDDDGAGGGAAAVAAARRRGVKSKAEGFPGDFANRFANEKTGVLENMAPEQVAAVGLAALADQCLGVLDAFRPWGRGGAPGETPDVATRPKRSFFSSPDGAPTSLDCLAFGYLALMVEPPVPRDWLRRTLANRYPELRAFATDVRRRALPADLSDLPWADAAAGTELAATTRGGDRPLALPLAPRSPARVARSFLHGLLQHVPVLGPLYLGEWRRQISEGGGGSGLGGRIVLGGVGLGVAAAALLGGCYRVYRTVWGAPLQTWKAERRRGSRLSEFGELGSMLDFSFGAAEAGR